MDFLAGVLALVLGFLIVAVVAMVLAVPTMLAWNYSMPHIFHLPEVGFWEAFSLNILSGMLIKSSSTSSSK